MRHHISYILAGLTAFTCLCSCSNNSNNDQSPENVEVITFENKPDSMQMSSLFSKFKIIQLEDNEQSIIGGIQGMYGILTIIDHGDMLIILTDDKQVLVFDREDGRFIREIGAVGEGPGEFLSPDGIYCNSDGSQIHVFDRLKGEIVQYTIDGQYIKNEKIEANLGYAYSLTSTSDGYKIISNHIYKPSESKYAYTIIRPDGTSYNYDEFSPIYTKKYITNFGHASVSVTKDKATFFKLLNDTIFSFRGGNISPLYKLTMERRIPNREFVAQLGEYGPDKLLEISQSSDIFTGFDRIFETKNHIILRPVFDFKEDIYWIDKNTNTGIHTPSLGVIQVIKGNTIVNIGSATENGIICVFDPDFSEFRKAFMENPDLKPFFPELKSFTDKFKEDGNPILIFYEY